MAIYCSRDAEQELFDTQFYLFNHVIATWFFLISFCLRWR